MLPRPPRQLGATRPNAKFDPETTQRYQKYDLNGSNQLGPSPQHVPGTYVDSCRIIRVDGFWRTAADMYRRQFGLLEHRIGRRRSQERPADDGGRPSYTTFVKDYLKPVRRHRRHARRPVRRRCTTSPPRPQHPDVVDLATAVQHGLPLPARARPVRRLLEKTARDTLAKSLADRRAKGQCLAGSSGLADCVLPFLPFTTINLTEIADWRATSPAVLAVNSGNLLSVNPSQPPGGRAYAGREWFLGQRAKIACRTRALRSAPSSRPRTTRRDDATMPPMRSPSWSATTRAARRTSSMSRSRRRHEPYVFYVFPGDNRGVREPTSGNHRCTTNTTLPLGGSVRVEHYWQETTDLDRHDRGTRQRPVHVQRHGGQHPDQRPARNHRVPVVPQLLRLGRIDRGTPGTIGSPVDDARNTETTT
jgi:hypothetical protein